MRGSLRPGAAREGVGRQGTHLARQVPHVQSPIGAVDDRLGPLGGRAAFGVRWRTLLLDVPEVAASVLAESCHRLRLNWCCLVTQSSRLRQ